MSDLRVFSLVCDTSAEKTGGICFCAFAICFNLKNLYWDKPWSELNSRLQMKNQFTNIQAWGEGKQHGGRLVIREALGVLGTEGSDGRWGKFRLVLPLKGKSQGVLFDLERLHSLS